MKKILLTTLTLILILSLSFIIGDAQSSKYWVNTWTEIEELGGGKFGATIHVGHKVFKDKVDGQYKKHKLTDERPVKDYILIQGAKCCVEVYPYYAKYFDVNHEEVRLYEERWIVQRLFKEPDKWRDVDAYNPIITTEETDSSIIVTISYTTDYGSLVVKCIQRDGVALKHHVIFTNTSGSIQTFRVLQKWAGIVGAKCNDGYFPSDIEDSCFVFHDEGTSQRDFNISENLYSMVFNEDGSEKTDQCLQRPVNIKIHAQGMKTDFIYGDWILVQDENLEIDPDIATLNNPTEDGYLSREAVTSVDCPTGMLSRNKTGDTVGYGGACYLPEYSHAYRGYVEWDISGLAGFTLTQNPLFKYEGDITEGNLYSEINPITEGAPSDATDANLWNYITSGIAYVDPFTIVSAPNQSQNLGASAKTDLQTAMTAEQSWFALGFQAAEYECPSESGTFWNSFKSGDNVSTPDPTLYVEYTLPPAYWTGPWNTKEISKWNTKEIMKWNGIE